MHSLLLLLLPAALMSAVACTSGQHPPSSTATPFATAGIPELSQQQKDTARAIFNSDARAQRLLSGHAHSTPDSEIGPWYDTNTGYLYGVGMGVDIPQPFYAEFDWPVLGPGDPYGETTQSYGAEVTHLFVLIDLNADKMVSMAPDNAPTVYPLTGTPAAASKAPPASPSR